MDQNKIGAFISETRKASGMTQKELAEKVGISDKTISKWECGNGLPEITILRPLCEILNINVNELLSGEHLSETVYSLKAEENIMALMKENEITQKGNKIQYIIGTVLIVFAFAFMLLFSGGNTGGENPALITYFLDFPTAILIFLFCGAGILLSGKKTTGDILGILQRICIPSSLFIALFGFVIVLATLPDMSLLGPNLAVCILSPIYGLAVYIVTVVVRAHCK